jgi:tetratricopeptide (TPR) repeat protein
MTATCPNCNSRVDLNDRFCGECGSALPRSRQDERRRVGEDELRDRLSKAYRHFMLERGAVAATNALPSFEAILHAAPDSPEAQFGKALCLAQLDRLAEALAFVDRAIALGMATSDRPAFTVEAVDPQGRVLLLDVGRSWALTVRTDVLLGLDRPTEALEQIEQAYEVGVSGDYAADLDAIRVIALVKLDRLDEAERALAEAAYWDDRASRACEACGRLRLMQKRPREAIDAFTAAIATAPHDAEYLILRAAALTETGRKREARTDLETALRMLEQSNAPVGEIADVRMRLNSL